MSETQVTSTLSTLLLTRSPPPLSLQSRLVVSTPFQLVLGQMQQPHQQRQLFASRNFVAVPLHRLSRSASTPALDGSLMGRRASLVEEGGERDRVDEFVSSSFLLQTSLGLVEVL